MPVINDGSINSLNNSRSTIIDNEEGSLNNDDFLKLLLVELEHQDPTEPMDSAKILTQTSQLATLEAQNSTTKAMEELAKQFGTTTALSSISAIGNRAVLGNDKIELSDNGSVDFDIDFQHQVRSGKLSILDSNDNQIAQLDLDEFPGGISSFTWDGIDASGERAKSGLYSVVANYSDGVSGNFTDKYGEYRVESVRFDGGKASLKLGNKYVPLSLISEIKPSS